jgi:hypothetical protein
VTNKIDLTWVSLIGAVAITAIILFAPCTPSAAQERSATSTEFSAQQQQDKKGKGTKVAPSARPAPQRAAPHRAAPRVAAPQRTAPRTVTQTKTTSRSSRQPTTRSHTVRQPKATRKVVAPAGANRKVVSPAAAPRVVTPRGTKAVTASRLRGVPARGAGRTVIRGQNYSVWRSGYRVRHGNGWRTFVALSALGAIAIGSSEYYAYAYISAPEPYCEGLTEDGCELMWQGVETIEGDVVNQCVAYCPWQ